MNPLAEGHTPVRTRLLCRCMEIILRDPSIPAYAGSSKKLTQLCCLPDVSLEQIVHVVEWDPGLAAQYLKLANSAYFLSTEKISTVTDALVRIGLDEVRRFSTVIAAMDLCRDFRKEEILVCLSMDWNEFWLHQLLTARLTQALVDCYRETSGKEYLAGLLHDVGKLLLCHYFPVEYGKVYMVSSNEASSVYDAECQLLDINHAEAGWMLGAHWGLESEITHAIRFHHKPEASPHRSNSGEPDLLTACLYVANSISHPPFKTLPTLDSTFLSECKHLKMFSPRKSLNLNLHAQITRANAIVKHLSNHH